MINAEFVKGGSVYRSLPFQPGLDESILDRKAPLFSQNRTPTYLFRVHDNNHHGYVSPVPPTGQDIFQLERSYAAALLWSHTNWKDYDRSQCRLTSWTSSLLVALQRGLYQCGNRYRRLTPSEVHLCIIDARNLPRRTLIQDLELMELLTIDSPDLGIGCLKNYLTYRKRATGSYPGEWFTQGGLSLFGVPHSSSTMQELMDAGLFEVLPVLARRETWTGWANRVAELRCLMQHGSQISPFTPIEETLALDKVDAHQIVAFTARCFVLPWTFSVAVMLIAMHYQRIDKLATIEAFTAAFKRKNHFPRSLYETCSKPTYSAQELASSLEITVLSMNLPELEPIEGILTMLHSKITRAHHLRRSSSCLSSS